MATFVNAAENGDIDTVMRELQNGVHIDAIGAFGYTALAKAAQIGHAPLAHFLLANHASTDARGPNEETPLMLAAANNHVEVLMILCNNGADANARDAEGRTALLIAVQMMELDAASFLINSGLVDVNIASNDGTTCLMEALSNGAEGIAILLIQRGADLDACNYDGTTALCIAAELGASDAARMMMEKGCDVDAGDPPPLIRAVEECHPEFVSLLLQYGASVTSIDSAGMSPLEVAAARGSVESFSHLLRGQNYTSELLGGALALAASAGFQDFSTTLINIGTDVNYEMPDGTTPLAWAAQQSQADIVHQLLQHGAEEVTLNERGSALPTTTDEQCIRILLHHRITNGLKELFV